jgi:hypothetical protein
MRITLTLEPDVALELRRKLKATKRKQKDLINAALRKGLPRVTVASPAPFKVKPHSFGLKPEYDADKMNQLYDQLLVEDLSGQQNRDLARR